MAFQVETAAIELIEKLRPVVSVIKRHDRSLADQLTRAASSVALNIAESNYSDPGNRKARLFTAAGSANESRAALHVAVAWGYCAAEVAAGPLQLLDRVIAMLWKLTRR
jgi:four helix bundle protein